MVDAQFSKTALVKLLIVDDSDEIRRPLVAFLTEEGYAASEARDGAEALRVFEMVGADLILMDIQMPVMNGIDAARELRRRDSALPIFAFTAAPHSIDESRGLFTAVMVKPMRLAKLCEALNAYFSAQRPR